MTLEGLEVASVEVNGLPSLLRDKPLEDEEECVEDPGVVNDVAGSKPCWVCELKLY